MPLGSLNPGVSVEGRIKAVMTREEVAAKICTDHYDCRECCAHLDACLEFQEQAYRPALEALKGFCKWLEDNGHSVNGDLYQSTDSLHYKCYACRMLSDAVKTFKDLRIKS